MPPSEERKLATVLFADLVGSTQMAHEKDPERTRLVLDRFYDAMAAELEHAGGTVEKFIGDAVVAAFGAPVAYEDHAERGLRAALDMQRRLSDLFGGRLKLRIGVNTGEIVAGTARQGSSFVTGDVVNVAARLEQAAEPGEILVGERTVLATRGSFEFGAATTIDARGKPQGIVCRRLLGALWSSRQRSDRETAFVGRTTELELLRNSYRTVVEQGRPYLVTVIGEAGVGKSRLIRQLWQWLAIQEPPPECCSGRCLSYGQGITYWPLGEILRLQLGILEDDPAAAVVERLGSRRILALTLGIDVAGDLHPLAGRDRLHDAWVNFLGELAVERPVVILVEDLHWAEDELLDLLERVVADVSGPLLLLCTARPELLDARPGWGGARRAAATLELEPLSAEDAGQLLERRLGADVTSSLSHVFVHAEGNPFFIEELVENLIDRGFLTPKDGGWTTESLPVDAYIPDSVRALLAARIDLLGPSEKAALQAASVVGRIFWASPIYDLLPDSDPDLRVLEERGFIQRRVSSSISGEREFSFKHQLTRDVAYGSLTTATRVRLHAGFAGWIERLGEGRDEHASLLAHHYAEAVKPEDADLAWAGAEAERERLIDLAVAWIRRAADLAMGRHELRDALSLLERAIPLASNDETIEILRQVGVVNVFDFNPEGFRAAMERALDLHPERHVAAEIYAELAFYGRGRPYMWRQPPPTELGEQWLASAVELADPKSHARATALLAGALATPEGGGPAAAEALAIAEEIGDARLLARVFEAHAQVASAANRYREAARWAERALEGVEGQGDIHRYWSAGFFYLRAGRVAEVQRLVQECERLAARMTPHDDVHALALRALLDSTIGRWKNVGELADRAEKAAEANVDTPCQFNWRTLLVCALALEHLGDDIGAQRLVELVRARAVVGGPIEREPAHLRLAMFRGDLRATKLILERMPSSDTWGLDGPAARLDGLVALGDRTGVEKEAPRFIDEESYYQPFAMRALGLVRNERALLAAALTGFRTMGLEWQAEQTRVMQEGGAEAPEPA